MPLYDEDIDPAITAFHPYLTGQARTQALRTARPLSSTPTTGAETPPAQPGASPLASQEYRAQALDYGKRALDEATTPPDMSQQVERYRRGYEGAGADIALAGMLGDLGGETGRQMAGHILKHAFAARAPQTTDYGTIDYGGFTADPMKERAFRVARLEGQQRLYEATARNAESNEQRQAAWQAANETKREIARMHDETRREIAASRRASGDRLHLQRAGTTPGGELVTFNPATGQQLVNGQPYNGPVMSQATLDKQATAVQESLGAINQLKAIDALVAKNPNAFGGVATLASLTPQLVASRWQSAKLTPQERQTRALVMTQAAQVINDLYGAAVSAGEMGRAQAFVPTNLDDPVTVAVKLKAAQAWANSKASVYGSQVRGAAEARTGGAPGAAGSLPPNVTVTREK